MNISISSRRRDAAEKGRGMASLRAARLFLLFAAIAVAGAGCGDDDPVQPGTSAFEARGVVLSLGTADTVVVDTTSLRGSLQLEENTTIENINVNFIRKDGTRGVPGSGYTLNWTVADPAIAEIQSSSAWQFKVTGKRAGSTTATFKLMNGSTTAYTSPAIAITVSGVGFMAGDSLTYSYQDLDQANQPSGSQQRKTWTVLRTGITYKDSSNVTEILERTTDMAGTIEGPRDTVYIKVGADGSIYQFDLLRSILYRADGGQDLGDQLPEQWVRISNPKQTTAATWAAMGVDSIDVKNLEFSGTQLNIAFRLDATHQGRVSTTVAGTVYPNAAHTDLRLRLNVRPSAFPIPLLFDSLMVRNDASVREGILRQVLESKTLQTSLGGQALSLPVNGYRMELTSYIRK